MTDELKPCPFCGGEATCIEETAWQIGCHNGQCAAEPFVWEPNKEMSIAAWNTRADLAAPMRCAECDCEKGGADCNWIATPAPAVKVKALVWTECNSGNFKQGHCFTARSMVDFAPIAVHKKADGWWLNKDCTTYPTIDAAKAAAQADYEATILAALEPATTMNDPLVEALMKKARAVVDRWDSPLWKDLPHTGESIDDLRAVLSALEENK